VSSAPVIENAQLPRLPAVGLPLNGTTTTTSSIDIVGHPGQVAAGGTLILSLNETSPANPNGGVNDLTITLTTPAGLSYTLPASIGDVLNQNFALPSAFTGTAIDGRYTLSITGRAGDVGRLSSYRLNITPEGFIGANASNAARVTLPTGADRSTSLNLDTLLFGEQVRSGTIGVTLVDPSGLGIGGPVAATLTGPGGQSFALPAISTSSVGLTRTFALPASFLFANGSSGANRALSGQYTLTLTNGGPNGSVQLSGFTIALAPQSLNGNAMDQNADGIPGEDPETTPFSGTTPGDDYAVPMPAPTSRPTTFNFADGRFPGGPYSTSTLPIVVSGPHVIATTVSGTGGSTTGATHDNLVANDQVGSVAVQFDRNVQVASFDGSQVLSILGPAGPIAGPQAFRSTGISRAFNSADVGRAIPKSPAAPLVSTLPIAGAGLSVSRLRVTVNITDPNDSSLTLTLIAPDGTRVPLASAVGGGGANFSNTTFADGPTAGGLTIPIAQGTAPFGLTYQPASPLSALAGIAIDGTWRLEVADSTTAGPAGRLNAWSLAITPQVPRASAAPLTSSLTISNPDRSFLIGHLAVNFSLTTPNDGNITAFLVAPDGTQVYLFGGVGGVVGAGGANFVNTTLDPSATQTIAQGQAPFGGTYAPLAKAGFATLASLFDPTRPARALDGTWKLVVFDSSPAGSPASTLESFSLVATPQIKVTPLQTYNSAVNAANPDVQTYISTDTGTQIYPSVDATYRNPIAIGPNLGDTATSTIAIPSTGGTFNIANLDVALSISYSRDTNLSARLIDTPTSGSPVTIPLFAAVGGLGANFGHDPIDNTNRQQPGNPNGQTYDYTVLSDSGTVDIAQGSAPFDSGSVPFDPSNAFTIYRPSSPLSALDGLPIDGTFTLQVTNDSSNAPVGQFNGWALIVTPRPAPAANGLPAGSTQPAEPIPVLFGPASASFPADPSPQPAFPPLISSIAFAGTGGTFTLADLSATLTLTAPADGNLADLSAVLIAPTGARATLFNAGDLSGAGTSLTRTFHPVDPISGQPTFANLPVDGTWQLEITDTNTARGGDVLNGWSLTATPAPVALKQPALPVPETPAQSLTSSITIPDNVPLKDLRLRLDLAAPRASDLSAVLIGPDGRSIRLFTGARLVDAGGAGFSNVVFDDNAASSIDAGPAPFSGTFRPEDPLSGFANAGTPAAGRWRLVIVDRSPGNDPARQAVLLGWSLINTPPAGTALANTFQVRFPTQQLSGTYSLVVGPGVLGADPSVANPMAAPDPSLGTPANPALNAGVAVLTGNTNGAPVRSVSSSYASTNLPLPIRPATVRGNVTSVSVLDARVDVPDNFPVQGVIQGPNGLQIPGLTVQLDATFPTDQNLSAVLIAPDGTRIRLFTRVGTGTRNFNNTVLDDTVNPPAPIASAGNGFFGRFNPQDPLSDLNTISHTNAQGIWTLEITNNGPSIGTLNAFSLTFQRPVPASGLGDPVAGRQTVNFRIFNIAPTNPLANDTWTAVGPAGITIQQGQDGTFAGPVASVAYDPSDPTRNTVYVGAASGGIWKTTDFLTTAPGGPTYLPLTDFGPNFGLNVGSIAVFGRNSNPDRSVLFAGTGFAQATYPNAGNSRPFSNIDGNAGRGVGILRSTDGGQTWTLLDSTQNVDAAGNELPGNAPRSGSSPFFRDHAFVGDTTFKIVVDPTPLPNGNIIVYAALGGPTGGLYQSIDSGASWRLLSAALVDPATGSQAAATDIILDPKSRSGSTGNVDIIYAAFQGVGVFISTNRGQTLSLMAGQQGQDPLIQTAGFPARPLSVGDAGATPNGANGRIVLGKPALTGNPAQDLLYQDWVYAAVENIDGTFNGLYITKDRGQNWTKVQLLSTPSNSPVTPINPTNNNTVGNSYDPTANKPGTNFRNGNSDLTLTIDPTNPNIVYLGGTQDFQASGLVRADLTNLFDAHNFVSFSNSRNDGGLLTFDTTGGVAVRNPHANTTGVVYPATAFGPTPFLNLRHAPNVLGGNGSSPFDVNATLPVAGAADGTDFTNDGTGVLFTPFDRVLKANPTDPTGSTNLHDATAFIDPVTGSVRLILADDQGVFTALLNADGTLNGGIGTAVAANYSRNGNLQDEQFFYGAAQPSNLAAQAAGALFYASGRGILAAQSDPNILANGNITWDDSNVLNPSPFGPSSSRLTPANAAITSSDRGGVGIATDPTGGANAGGPTGSGPSVYEFDVPGLGGNVTDFFRVNQVGQTTGLVTNAVGADFPFDNFQASGTGGNDAPGATDNGQIPLGNFAVNPLDGSQILIGSATGRLYETVNKGVQFLPIGQPGDFDGTQLSALAYAAPDPNAQAGLGNLNNFLYAGTVGNVGTTPGADSGGHIYVTQDGGRTYINISSGLDGASVVGIYPSPNRGEHSAYAVTLNGVFYTADSLAAPAAGQAVWANITGNLAQIQHDPFGDARLAEARLSTFRSNTGAADRGTAQYGGFSSIVADYRYQVPDPTNPGATYPVVYVSGFGGVFRSLDNGQTWTVFPNTAFDSAPVDGGYLPSVSVTDLQLNLGAINPATGHAGQVQGDPEVLLASTFGRGEFAIRLAPVVFTTTVGLDSTMPAPGGSSSGAPRGNPALTNVAMPFIAGTSEISNYGNVVTITLIDLADGKVIGQGTTDTFGHFSVQVGQFPPGSPLTFDDPSFLVDGPKSVGIQATDSSGAKGNVTTFNYTFKRTPPPAPGGLVLERASDTGRSQTDDITNISTNIYAPSMVAPTIVAPVFDVTSAEPTTTVLELRRADTRADLVAGRYLVVANAAGGTATVRLTDGSMAQLAGMGPVNSTFFYEVVQVDQAGNVSNPSGILPVTVDTVPPSAPASVALDPASNSSPDKGQTPPITNVVNPAFNVTESGGVGNNQLFLYRSTGGGTPILVGAAPVGASQVQDRAGAHTDGTYFYQPALVDVAGNISRLGVGVAVTISTQAPVVPTLILVPADNSGAPLHPNTTNVRSPRFANDGPDPRLAGLPVSILRITNGDLAAGVVIAGPTTVAPNGSYLVRVNSPLADGVYTVVARVVNRAGTPSYSAPLTLTIKGTGPQVVPRLSIFGPDDTGIKGDGVTANHRPRIAGVTDRGVTVNLYTFANGQVGSTPQATVTSSSVDGSFRLTLANNEVDGSTQLVAQAVDIAGNRGALSPALNLRIITVAGDYLGIGSAQLATFRPTDETYAIRGDAIIRADATPGRDIPVQVDTQGSGRTDPVAYRFDAADYHGDQTQAGTFDFQYGQGNLSLPVPGYYGGFGTLIYADYRPNTGFWFVALPTAGGQVVKFGVPNVDIPTPSAFDGGGAAEIAVFRPTAVGGGDADSFNVMGPRLNIRSASRTRRSPGWGSPTGRATSPPPPTMTGSAATSSRSTGRAPGSSSS